MKMLIQRGPLPFSPLLIKVLTHSQPGSCLCLYLDCVTWYQLLRNAMTLFFSSSSAQFLFLWKKRHRLPLFSFFFHLFLVTQTMKRGTDLTSLHSYIHNEKVERFLSLSMNVYSELQQSSNFLFNILLIMPIHSCTLLLFTNLFLHWSFIHLSPSHIFPFHSSITFFQSDKNYITLMVTSASEYDKPFSCFQLFSLTVICPCSFVWVFFKPACRYFSVRTVSCYW